MADPLSTGASVVAFVGLALSSAKAIHDILSAVKDGPQTVKRLADEVKQLGDILVRLPQLQINTINITDLADLASVSSQCNTDLSGFSAKLQRLSCSDGDRRVGRIWKRLKVAITEKDLDQMRDSVRYYIGILNIRVTLLMVTQVSSSTTQSATQSAEMIDILRQLQAGVRDQGMSMSAAPTTPANRVEEITADTTAETDPAAAKLEESIDRLIALVKEKQCTVESDDAEQLIADLQTLLDSAQAKEPFLSAESPTDDQGISTVAREQNVLRELKLASSLIFSAPLISVNATEMVETPKHMPCGFTLQQQRKRKVIDIGSGSLTVETNKRRRVCQGRNASTDVDGGSGRDFVAKILFRPNNAQSLLSIYVCQGQILGGSFLGIPRLLLSNIIPKNSMVFTIAETGQVQELMALVAEGKASLQDRDQDGWSLLHYAAEEGNTPMVQFLIQHGLDIDDTSSGMTPLNAAIGNHRCLNVLLAAGADPTLETGDFYCPLVTASTGRRWVTPMMFRHSQHFGLSTFRNSRGRSLILTAFETILATPEPRVHLDRLSFLLNNGCSVSDVDNNGFNCLHVFFTRTFAVVMDIRASLIYVIGQGADVYATDRYGRSVSQLAYSTTCRSRAYDIGSYNGDIWDAVLDSCGYSISKFRKGYPRRAIYTRDYSRQYFERLWEGREDRCPYWDDAEWRSPEDGDHDCIRVFQSETVCVCTTEDQNCVFGHIDLESDSEAAEESEEDLYVSDSSSEDIRSEYDGDRPEEQCSSPVHIGGSQRANSPESYASGPDNSYQRTPQNPFFRHHTETRTEELEELLQSPWNESDVHFNLDDSIRSLSVLRTECQGVLPPPTPRHSIA